MEKTLSTPVPSVKRGWKNPSRGATRSGKISKGTKMELKLIPKVLSDKSTIGELLIDGVHQCYTLEPPIADAPQKPRAIPEGTYTVALLPSPRFARIVPHLQDVPDFDAIEIHYGNFPRDTHGCILVGEAIDANPNQIDSSRKAFDALMLRLRSATGDITITISRAVGEESPALASESAPAVAATPRRGRKAA